MDISSKGSYPSNALSNFAGNRFTVDGIECSSMEGFLQSLKFENIESQKNTCTLIGGAAKKKGSGRNKYWQSKQTLWWNGKAYERKGKEYQLLLNKAFNRLNENERFRKALESTGKAVLTHSMGKNKEKETVLTEREFCSRLMYLRDKGKLIENKSDEGN